MSSSSSTSSSPTNSSLGNASVQVVVRLRPMNDCEKRHGTLPVVTASTQEKSVTVIKGHGARQVRTSYSFDNVFTSFSTQEEVFHGTLKPVISDVLRGYESTVFAYGQTGTGKTYTMEGDLSNADMQGIIPRSAQSIFEALKHPQVIEYQVTCSYLEIYNEELGDLFADETTIRSGERKSSQSNKLDIMEGKNGTFCRGLTEKQVESSQDVFELMQSAQHQRKIGETKMNKHSSRSHCIFTMRIQSKVRLDDGNGIMEYNGKLHMVDLAGSECAKTASLDKSCGSEIARERERMNINRSLLTLGRVISILKDQSSGKKSHSNARIPYRDSKLTRILQESLGGRCKTVVIATLSPSVTAIEESISTLNYAQSANGIVNKPISHSFLSVTPGASISIPTQKTNGDIGQETTNTVDSWYEMECRMQYMQAQVEEAQAALARKHLQQQDLVDRAEKAESEKIDIEKKFNEATDKARALEKSLDKEKQERKVVEEKLEETETSLKKTTLILKATQRTERLLTNEANALLATLKDSITDGDILHKNLMDYRKEEEKRKLDAREFHETSSVILDSSLQTLNKLFATAVEHLASIQSSTNNSKHNDGTFTKEIISLMEETASAVKVVSDSIKDSINSDDGITSSLLKVSTNVKKHANEMSAHISREGEALQEITETTRGQLDANIAKMKKLGSLNKKTVNDSMTLLEKNLSASNERLSQMIEHVMSAVNILQEKKALCRKKLQSIAVNEAKEAIDLAKHSELTAKSNSTAVEGALKEFMKEFSNLDDIDESLETQRNLLKEEGTSHVNNTEKQSALIDIQKKLISSVCDQQMKLHSEVISKVMSGVNDLLNQQMESMKSETNALFSKYLLTSNNSIKETSLDLETSAKNMIKNSEHTNDYLNAKVQDIRQKNLAFSKIVSAAKDSLDDLVETSVQQQNDASLFRNKIENMISLTASLDVETENELEKVVSTGRDVILNSSANLLENANSGFVNINKLCHDLMEHSTNTFELCSESLSSMKRPIKSGVTKAQNSEKEINLAISECHEKVNGLTEQQYSLVNKSLDVVQSNKGTLRKKVMVHENLTNKEHDKLTNSVNELTNTTKACIPESISNSRQVQVNIENFTSNALGCRDNVKEVPPRSQFIYKEELSFTPADSEIILNTAALSTINDKENESDISTERSLESAFSSPPLSPALRERSTSKENSMKISSSKKTKADSSRSRIIPGTSKRRNSIRKVPTPQSLRKKARVVTGSSLKSKRKNESYF